MMNCPLCGFDPLICNCRSQREEYEKYSNRLLERIATALERLANKGGEKKEDESECPACTRGEFPHRNCILR